MAKKQKMAVNLDMNGNEVQNASFEKLAAAPASAAEGRVYYDSVNKVPMFNNGTSNIPIGGGVSEFKNTAITPASGVASWEISNPAGSPNVSVKVYEIASGDEVQMCVNIASASPYDIKIEWNESAASVAADTYRAIVVY